MPKVVSFEASVWEFVHLQSCIMSNSNHMNAQQFGGAFQVLTIAALSLTHTLPITHYPLPSIQAMPVISRLW